jgi:phosphoribosyl 1,2-cyclic phosphodiesterase
VQHRDAWRARADLRRRFGAEALSSYLTANKVKDLDIFFSHCHLDHIMGLPFLKPLYDHEVGARIHAGHFEDATTCKEMVDNFMAPPYFPVTPKYFDAHIRYVISALPTRSSAESSSKQCG